MIRRALTKLNGGRGETCRSNYAIESISLHDVKQVEKEIEMMNKANETSSSKTMCRNEWRCLAFSDWQI